MQASKDIRREDVHVEVPESTTGSPLGRDQPPNYAAATSDAPPSYESVFGQMKRAKSESTSKGAFIKRILKIICCGTITVIFFLAFSAAIPIAQIVMGAIHKDNCPIEKYIPIYNIVGGVFGILIALVNLSNHFRKKKNDDDDEDDDDEDAPRTCCDIVSSSLSGLFGCFMLPWFIAGSVWVYRIYGDVSYVDTDPNYCQRDLYLFTFWIITIAYIFIALGCFCGICGAAVTFACVKVGKDNDDV